MKTSFLFQPKEIAPLAVYRILMGFLMAAEGFGAIITGWVRTNYVDVTFAFHFIGFDFLDILVGPQAYVVYALLGVFGLFIAFGYRYRFSVLAYTILWAAVYFGQKTSYNNHYYLLLLICIMLNFIPANHFASLDVKSGRVKNYDRVPNYAIWSIKMLLLIVYFYAALAKLYPDWLDGKPVEIFLSHKADSAFFKNLFANHTFIMAISYGGILFDFLVIPALWYKPTRKLAFAVSIFFHLFNSIVFHIGIFPYMMLSTSVLFFDSKWIRNTFFKKVALPEHPEVVPTKNKPILKAGTIVFFALMVLLPLRHFYFPGSAHWTEEGHRMSWHMMLRSKSGTINFVVQSSKQEEREVLNPRNHMSKKMARKLASRPDMIWQFAQRIKKEYHENGYTDVSVYAETLVKFNGRNYTQLIDPEVDLANTKRRYFGHNDWILQHPDL